MIGFPQVLYSMTAHIDILQVTKTTKTIGTTCTCMYPQQDQIKNAKAAYHIMGNMGTGIKLIATILDYLSLSKNG